MCFSTRSSQLFTSYDRANPISQKEALEKWKSENQLISERIRNKQITSESDNKLSTQNLDSLHKYIAVRYESNPGSPSKKPTEFQEKQTEGAALNLNIFHQLATEGVDKAIEKYESNIIELRRQVYGGVKLADIGTYLETTHPDMIC